MSQIDLPGDGVGIGLRRSLVRELQACERPVADFLEVAPENWMGLGGRLGEQFSWFAERYPVVCHGLSLSIGGTDPLDEEFLYSLKGFLKQHNIAHYSEHLSYCSGDGGHLYDLMPLPFTPQAVKHVAERVSRVQDILGQRISLENVSYYATVDNSLAEVEFINAVLEAADCYLLLDVNNIFVNAINHCYDPMKFLKALPAERVSYIHVAGHYDEAEDLKIDTHGADVKDEVWQMLAAAYEHVGLKPTLLERDFNIPPLADVLAEAEGIRRVQKAGKRRVSRSAA